MLEQPRDIERVSETPTANTGPMPFQHLSVAGPASVSTEAAQKTGLRPSRDTGLLSSFAGFESIRPMEGSR